MRNITGQEGKSDHAGSSLVTDLAWLADQALIEGDSRRCIAIIENIYDLLESRHPVS